MLSHFDTIWNAENLPKAKGYVLKMCHFSLKIIFVKIFIILSLFIIYSIICFSKYTSLCDNKVDI